MVFFFFSLGENVIRRIHGLHIEIENYVHLVLGGLKRGGALRDAGPAEGTLSRLYLKYHWPNH